MDYFLSKSWIVLIADLNAKDLVLNAEQENPSDHKDHEGDGILSTNDDQRDELSDLLINSEVEEAFDESLQDKHCIEDAHALSIAGVQVQVLILSIIFACGVQDLVIRVGVPQIEVHYIHEEF